MVRNKFKWKFALFLYLILLSVFTKSLPISMRPLVVTTELPYVNSEAETSSIETVLTANTEQVDMEASQVKSNETEVTNISVPRNTLLRQIRPGQEVRNYDVELTYDGNQFIGRTIIDVVLTQATRDDPIIFHAEGLNINRVMTGVFTEANAIDADYDDSDGVLEIEPPQSATSYVVIVEYTVELSNAGSGLYLGEGNDASYIAMNLHPTDARRVFPCMDEPTEASTIRFTFNNIEYTNMISNSLLEDNSQTQFRALQGPAHLWGMVAHNFINMNIPITNVILTGRPGLPNQDSQASLAINSYFNFFNEWTNKPYFEIVVNQAANLHVIAIPDIDVDWHSLSIVGIWEPHILMETGASVKQRKTVLVKIAEALAKQWFGYVIFPENWRHEWVVSGLATYAAYEAVKSFQSAGVGSDITLLDMNTIFVTDIIQESLLRDSYISSQPLEPGDDIFEEEDIRDNIYGLLKYKAPAIMHMLKFILGDESIDFIQMAARALLTGRSLETVNSLNFIDAVNSHWMAVGSPLLDEFDLDFLEPWILNTGYPLLHVGLRQGGVFLTQERFALSNQPHIEFDIPLSFTTSINPNFDNVQPSILMTGTMPINMILDEEDWVLFNIQGQGYYRVNYDADLWERIIEALEDPDRREEIHPLNRATLVDDALNLARAGRIDYEIAFQVVLSMEHETEYAVWKAFVRNMEFLRKRLVAMVTEDEDLDPDIYLRMVRRTVGRVEAELGFQPDPLITEPSSDSLTRGLVMDHACRANYQPCIAAAVDLFYDPNNNGVVNPNIPHEIRPAVYCTMVREGDDDVIEALNNRLEIEPSHYERVVILESLACSQDDGYIRGLLEETITPGNRYAVEERVKIFKAVTESSFENAWIAINFMSRRSSEILSMYGGLKKREELIFILAENMADDGLATDFLIWVNSQNNDLDDSQDIANRALRHVNENLDWDNRFLEYVYEWIDENDAPTMAVSLILVGITFMLTIFNH